MVVAPNRGEPSTASANAWKLAALNEPPHGRPRHTERAARFLDGNQGVHQLGFIVSRVDTATALNADFGTA